jgi:hypothetical protein
MTPQPLPPGLPGADNLTELRRRYAGKCRISLNQETNAWEAIWYPAPTTMCLSYAPDLATLAAKLSAEGWATS